MRKTMILLAAVAVALTATAANRLYLPDFTICPGETIQVALILENEEQFTAFQTDLLLPEGLDVLQEDGEYLIDLTSRNASDQVILSKLRDDGALRIVSFCMSVKSYSGTSGALAIINLKADDDFIGPSGIGLKHSFLSTVEGVQFNLSEENCQVLSLSQQLKGDTNGDGMVNITDVTFLIDYLLAGCQSSFHIENADVNADDRVDIADVTRLIDYLLSH